MKRFRAKTLILGVGNILLSDEGIGVRVIEYLQTQDLPKDIELADGGTAGADLIDILADRKMVIIVDAIQSDKAPGTIMRFGPEQMQIKQDNGISLHELDIPQTLAMTHLLKKAPTKVSCIGVVPESIKPGLELSKTIAPLVSKIGQIIIKSIKSV